MDCHNNRSLLYASQPVSFISFHFFFWGGGGVIQIYFGDDNPYIFWFAQLATIHSSPYVKKTDNIFLLSRTTGPWSMIVSGGHFRLTVCPFPSNINKKDTSIFFSWKAILKQIVGNVIYIRKENK